MARWSLVMKSSLPDHESMFLRGGSPLLALLSTLLLFSVCVALLLALCAAHGSSPTSSSSLHVLNARTRDEERDGSLAIAAPEEFKKQQEQEFSFRWSSAASAAISKLSHSLRISSFRDSSTSASFRNSSFRMSSFRVDSTCKQADGVMDSFRRVRPAGVEEEKEVAAAIQEPAVWQRVILRGERCSPLTFPGLILYDAKGNQVPSGFVKDTEAPDVHTCNNNQSTAMEDAPRFGSTSGSEVETGF